QHCPARPGARDRVYDFSAARADAAGAVEKKRHVAAELRSQRCKLLNRIIHSQEPIEPKQHPRRVGASSSKAAARGNTLGEMHFQTKCSLNPEGLGIASRIEHQLCRTTHEV